MKSAAVILAAVAACASAASLAARDASCPSYQSLGNGSTGKCIIYNSYNSNADQYTLTLGECGSDVQGNLPLALDPDTKTLHTMDNNYCVGVLSGFGSGAQVGLVRCGSESKGEQWSHLSSTAQWKDGYGLCLDFNGHSMVQDACQANPPPGSMQQYGFSGPKSYTPCPQPPPPPPTNPQQSCGSWAVKYGGSPNACGSNMMYTASDSATCNADGSNCQTQCCSNKLY